jgi:hypothetical protein
LLTFCFSCLRLTFLCSAMGVQTTKQQCKQDRDEPGESDLDFEEMKVGSGSKRRREA